MKPYRDAAIEAPSAAPASISIRTVLRRLTISLIAWSTHAAVMAMLLLVFVVMGRQVRQDVEEFQLGLPAVSEPLLGLCKVVADFWYVPVVALIVIDGPIAVAVCYLPRTFQWITWVWYAGFLLVAITLLTWACVGLISPLIFVMGPLMADPFAPINIHPSTR
ncbi:hypothetical protein AB1K70_03645 [Bremerella sp. JC770]|uniref:hypothetical protein n=1 Tax=Bremerella sp. JC770 TaxID=3232137 RepID=UPI00345AF9FF